jgi:hypothetical protein
LEGGADFRLAKGYLKPFYDYKFKRSRHRYEVGLCIKTGNFCLWNGPYEPGDWNNKMIFKDVLAKNWRLPSSVKQIGVTAEVHREGEMSRWVTSRSRSGHEGKVGKGEELAENSK